MKRYIAFLVLTFLLFNLSAQEISFDDARQKAQDFFFATDKTLQTLKSASVVKVDTFAIYYTKTDNQLKSAGQKEEPAFYIFNRTDKPGFVIVSADKRIRDVIAYSNTGVFCEPNPGLKALLNQYVEEISYAKENNFMEIVENVDYSQSTLEVWISGLKDIAWDQSPDPYNTRCPPFDAEIHCPVGCQATVLGQILYHFKYPRVGKLEYSYTTKTNGYNVSAVFGSPNEYRYELMEDKPSGIRNDQIAKLLYHCGVSQDMDYKLSESSANTSALPNALRKYFGYKAKDAIRIDFSSDYWKTLIKKEISNERPVAYRGGSAETSGGHIFIVDGYNEIDQFHINWGWGGRANGFFKITLLNIIPAEENEYFTNYHYNQFMIVGIEPANPDNTSPYVLDTPETTVNASDLKTNIVFTFNEPINESSLINNIIVEGEKSNKHVYTHSYDVENYKLTIDPINDFQSNERITVTLTTGITDLFGNELDGNKNGIGRPDFTYNFTTVGFTHDYAVKSISVSNRSPKLGEKVYISSVIQNVGKEEELDEQTITFYDNGSPVKSYSGFASLAIGNEITQNFEWTTTAGIHTLKVGIARSRDENPLNDFKYLNAFCSSLGSFVVDGDQNSEIVITLITGLIKSLSFSLKLKSPNEITASNLKNSEIISIPNSKFVTEGITTTVSSTGEKSNWIILSDGSNLSLTDESETNYNFGIIAPAGTAQGTYNAGIDFTSADSTAKTKVNLIINVIEPTTGFAAYEYWFDDEYESKKYKEINSQNILELNTNIPTTGLEDGLHSFHFRVLDNNGQWSTVTSRFFNKLPLSGVFSKIIAYEYWFDNDFNSKETEFIRGRQTVSLDDDIDINSLQFGLHSYHIRFLDNTMSWSPVSSQFFLKLPPLPEGDRIITACEYWFDDDFTNKVSTEITPGQTITTNEGFDVSALQTGLHSYHVRYKDDAGQWSSVVSEFFHKLPALPEGARVITACEYWFDDDYANKISADVISGQTITTITGFDVSELTTGLHSYHVRYKDDAGQWSSVLSEFFHKLPISTSTDNLITSYRYWFDNDDASMITVVLPEPINPYQLIRNIITDNLASGVHNIHFQFSDLNHTWSSVLTSAFEIESPQLQQISLNAGWNIMSLYVMPKDPNLKNILQPRIDDGKLKKVMDESGKVIEDWGTFGGWQNTIVDAKNTEGYKINVTSPTTVEVTGIPTQLPFDISLNTGWNIISWPSPIEQDGMAVFQPLIDAGKLKKVMNESGKVIENWGIYGGWQNGIGNLQPGEGYAVNVTSDCVLTIKENVTEIKSEEILSELIASTHFIPAYNGNGIDHMNINLVNLSESGIIEGDEIGIFDGNICVGSAQISSSFVSFNNISIPVSAVDGIEGKNGYTESNAIMLKLFRNGNEYPIALQPLNQSKTVFEKGESLFAQVDLVTGLEGLPISAFSEINVYPNPFCDEVNVEINLKADAQVQVEVLNQLGQVVKFLQTEKILNNGVHRLTWDGRNFSNGEVTMGIYHLKVTVDGTAFHRKIVYSK